MTVEKSAIPSPVWEGLTRLILCSILLLSCLMASGSPVSARPAFAFDTGIVIPYGAADGAAVWGDINNDGDLDLLVSGRGRLEAMTTLLLGNDSGSLDLIGSAGLPSVEASSLALADFDRDGDLDVLITGQRGVTLSGELGLARIYQNDGSGSFSLYQDLTSTGVYRGSAEWADYDQDGDLDILLTGYQNGGNGFGAIYRNDGGFFVVDSSVSVPAVGDSSVAWADYDGDSDLDFVVIGRLSETSSTRVAQVFTNDGSGGFSITDLTVNGLWNGAVAWLDADSDGDLDLILTGNNGPDSFNRDPVTLLFHYNSANGFNEVPSGLPGVWQSSLAVGDFDNDGDSDLLLNGLSTTANLTHIYTNTIGTFSDSGIGLQSGTGATVTWGDLNGDKSIDATVTGVESSAATRSTYVYTNLPDTANTAPNAPAAISACWDGTDQVFFNWSGADDAQTPANGLSYYLRVGSAPDSGDILSPPSAPDGYHRLVQPGPLHGATRGVLKGLPAGEYYWSVQAVDTAYAASPFASGGAFLTGTDIARNDDAWVSSPDPILIDVLQNDNRNYSDLVIQSVQNPVHGTTSISGDQVQFTPDPNWAGVEEFAYYALSPSTGHCSRGFVSVKTTGLYLHPTWVKEGKPTGTIVGGFTATPTQAKPGETFTFHLISGPGSEDNSSFRITANKLVTAAVFDASVKNTYSIRVKAYGSMGTILTRQFTITVLDVNLNPPTDIQLSNSAIQENVNANTSVGNFSCDDPEGSPCMFRLQSGPGSEDNALFSIAGVTLRTQAVFDFETRSSYSIRVRATDNTGEHLDKVFSISIINVSDSAPTGIVLSNSSIAEMQPANSLVGQFSTIDSDPADTFRYRLVSGEGSTDNTAFRINGSQLLSSIVFDIEMKSSYTFRVRSTDQTDRFVEQVGVVTIVDGVEELFFMPALISDESH